MRILAIGDIHGCASALDTLLKSIDLQPDDTLVTLGDYVDRGSDSREVIDRLLELTATRRVISLRGNHDQVMLAAREGGDALRDWRAVGGAATVKSYKSLGDVPASHWRFLEQTCVDYWECETHFFVHGGVYPDVPLAEQPAHQLYWARFEGVQPHISGKVMVCGHTSQKDGYPRNLGYAVCIDTWAHAGQWLTCLDVGGDVVHQADINGETRKFSLGDLKIPEKYL